MKSALILLFFLFSFVHGLAQIQASPEPIQITQPDGSKLTLIGKGTMYVSYTETLDGFVIVRNAKKIYEYAIPDSIGDLITSGMRVHEIRRRTKKEKKFLKKIEKHYTYTGKKLEELLDKTKNNKITP